MWYVIRFLNAEDDKPKDMYTRMLAKYGASCISKTQFYESITREMIAAISDLMRENRRIAISKTAMEMKTGVVSAHTIAAEELYYRNVSERCKFALEPAQTRSHKRSFYSFFCFTSADVSWLDLNGLDPLQDAPNWKEVLDTEEWKIFISSLKRCGNGRFL